MARQAGDPATEAAALVTLACAQPLSGREARRSRELLAEARAVATRARAYQPLLRTSSSPSRTCWKGLGQHKQAAAVARDGDSGPLPSTGLARTSWRDPGRQHGRAAGFFWAGGTRPSEVIEHSLRLEPAPA